MRNPFIVPGARKRLSFVLQGIVYSCALLVGIVFTSLDVSGQHVDISGRTWIANWPDIHALNSRESGTPIDYQRYRLLPFMDTLSVDYRIEAVQPDFETVSMHFAIEWTSGDGGILAGKRVGPGQMPAGVVIKSIDLLMQVQMGEEHVADFLLPLDSIGLGTVPAVTYIAVENVAWDSVFVNVDADGAREIFEAGFELTSPRILHAVFSIDRTVEDPYAVLRPALRSEPYYTTEFTPRVDIWISLSPDRNRYAPPPETVRKGTRAPRGEMGRSVATTERGRPDRGVERPDTGEGGPPVRGRTTEGDSSGETTQTSGDSKEVKPTNKRSSGRSGGGGLAKLFGSGSNSSDDDDDDDDDARLLVAALAGVAAVGAVVFIGGTVGYFGSGSKAPIGLMSGYVGPRGGALLQAAFNRQVFGKADGPENVIVSGTGFYDVFHSPLQPAVGIGARFTEEGTSTARTEPSVSIGLVGNFGRFVVLTGYDLTTPDFRFGIGINLRYEK